MYIKIKKINMYDNLFVAKFRPKTLDEILLPRRIKDEIGDGVIKQNLLFYGSAGSGKTSLARILAKDYPTLYINVSDESSVEIVRTKITDFCSTISVLDNKEMIKVVILDELDGASEQFYKALRGTIEKFETMARFIGTCNFINKLPNPIISRFVGGISFDFVSKEEEKEILVLYIKRTIQMLKQIGIKVSQEAAIEFVKRNFPDFRMIVGKIQSFYDKGIKEINIEDIKTLNYTFNDVFDICLKEANPLENYKFVMSNYISRVDDVLSSLGKELPNYIREHKPEKISLIAPIIIEVAEHQAKRNFVIDPVILLLSAVFKIQMILNK